MNLVKKPGFTNSAVIVVSILIGLVLLVIGVLAYELAKQERLLPGLNAESEATSPTVTSTPEAPSISATVTKAPASPPTVSATATKVPPRPIVATGMSEAVPAPPETPTDEPPTTDTSAPTMQQTPEPSYAHPTYEPTTQPCQDCHSNIRGGGG